MSALALTNQNIPPRLCFQFRQLYPLHCSLSIKCSSNFLPGQKLFFFLVLQAVHGQHLQSYLGCSTSLMLLRKRLMQTDRIWLTRMLPCEAVSSTEFGSLQQHPKHVMLRCAVRPEKAAILWHAGLTDSKVYSPKQLDRCSIVNLFCSKCWKPGLGDSSCFRVTSYQDFQIVRVVARI